MCVSALCRCLRLFVVRSQWLLECCAGAGGGWARHGVGSQDKAAVLAFPGDPDEETWGCLQRFQNSVANRPILFGVRVFLSGQGFLRSRFAILIAVVVNRS